MRYNEKELRALSRQPAELAAELGMRGPKKGSVAKRRLVKLVVNFLFYFRTDEAEVGARAPRGDPRGRPALTPVSRAAPRSPAAGALQSRAGRARRLLHHYEYMRRSLIFYRNEIQKMTGKDPLEQFGISEETRFQLSSLPRDGQSARVSSRLDELD
ncbi:pleckstrin homology domain-containing family J member 1 isoform X2 [Sciurus carolinensis]|uniref:pleckstrin homology domain-containing family J member 1 isoform X2 n=1 Tax=Sciurus carolinensis TaxID=30640 RepID=UPI001FB2FF37|nr:pleckstrin homology domain-containing family J member 1 isoform X2 [Sciurus carolinensis]